MTAHSARWHLTPTKKNFLKNFQFRGTILPKNRPFKWGGIARQRSRRGKYKNFCDSMLQTAKKNQPYQSEGKIWAYQGRKNSAIPKWEKKFMCIKLPKNSTIPKWEAFRVFGRWSAFRVLRSNLILRSKKNTLGIFTQPTDFLRKVSLWILKGIFAQTVNFSPKVSLWY